MKRISSKKVLSVLLSAVFAAGMFSGCGQAAASSSAHPVSSSTSSSSSANTEGFPISDEKITLRIAVMQTAIQPDFNEVEMFKKYEEMTNIHIEWEMIPQEFVAERRNIIMASGELPDAFMRCGFSTTDIENYATQGMFVKLDDYMDQYAPNFKAALEEYPDVDSGIRMSDGSIYSFPYIVSALSPRVSCKLFFNTKALEGTNQKLPTTTDELYDTLKGLASYDLNGNGEPDEIPLSGSIEAIIELLNGAWGLQTRGASHPYVDVDTNGDLRFIPASEEYKEVLEYVAKLYSEGLIDSDAFTIKNTELAAKGEEGRVLAFSAINHSFMGQTYQNDYVGLDTALEGHGGEKTVPTASTLNAMGAFVITNANKHVEETIRWIDYFYSEEGMQKYFMGEEGVTFEVASDGSYQYLPIINENPNGLSFEQAVSLYVPWAGGCNPTVANDKYFQGAAMKTISLKAANALAPYATKTIWPTFTFSEEYNQTMATLSTDIGTYVKEMRAQFITGKKPFSEWEDYVREFEKIGLEEYMNIYKETAACYEA